ncbi:alanine--tRNA ligase [Rickettsiales bacterium (ex Bugula neritina AB1)]|nr:alanine--tRNA ligase [Rickettsiales bacterium (ex Bugula neritina AB1)]
MLKNYHELKKNFIAFFVKKQHVQIKASSLIPKDSTAVLFTNSGMMQFIKYFKKEEKPLAKRITNIQPCIRLGGKHNDIDNIGKTLRHVTFFEMMGSFSFDDYGKKEAIEYAYEFLTKILKLKEKNLFITVYHEDEEAYNIWRLITQQPILKIKDNDNFWSMGELGPSGPCTEIYYYTGNNIGNEKDFEISLKEEISSYVEIWNIVFMEYDRTPNGLVPLPNICIDTGMGLERILAILEGVNDIYKTSILKEFISKIQNDLNIQNNKARIIGDHIRTAVFIINENIIPSNEGHGYVLRKILRRAFTYGNTKDPVLYNFVEFIINIYKHDYQFKNIDAIIKIIKEEELIFIKSLERGFKKLETYTSSNINEETIFKLQETYGLPIQFSLDYWKKQGIYLKEEEIKKYMNLHRNISNKTINIDLDYSTKLMCYTHIKLESQIICLLQNNKITKEINNGEFLLITNSSPFYPRGGGQEGDIGNITTSNCFCEVIDTTKKKNTIIHHCKLISGIIKIGDKCNMNVDENFRKSTTIHHTLTHILCNQLQKMFGNSLQQKGSKISDKKLRFDFNCHPLTEENKQNLIEEINKIINDNIPVEILELPLDEALKRGAQFLPNMEYQDKVRVIKIGDFAFDLCGGTHVKHTGEIKKFLLIKETSLQKGIRRIEAKGGVE